MELYKSAKEVPITDSGKQVAKAVQEETATPRYGDALINSGRAAHLLGDALAVGAGTGIAWYAAKALIERIYRTKLERNMRNSNFVGDLYRQRTSKIQNNFITDPKYASFNKQAGSVNNSTANTAKYHSSETFVPAIKATHDPIVAVNNKSVKGIANNLALALSETPGVYNALAYAAIPAVFAGAAWGGNSLAKWMTRNMADDKAAPLADEKLIARKRYSAAAKLLREVSRGEYKKKGSYEPAMKKQALGPALLGLGALGTGAALYGYNQYNNSPDTTHAYTIPDRNIFGSPTADTIAGLGMGLAGLALMIPGYRFVQNARKGYKDRVDAVSDVTRASQAWDAIRGSRGNEYASIRAALEDEPDLGLKDDFQLELERLQRQEARASQSPKTKRRRPK